jgi:glutathione S-transferase
MLAVRELALPHSFTQAGGPFGVVDTPEFAKLNPNRTVPVIDDGGFVLWESNAIVRYLSARYGVGSLWPEDVCLRADADRWMDWQATEWQGVPGPDPHARGKARPRRHRELGQAFECPCPDPGPGPAGPRVHRRPPTDHG